MIEFFTENGIFILNTLVMLGVIVAAVLTVVFDKLLSSIIALGVTGAFVGLEFILLHAPDVAIAEVAVGAVLTSVIFIVALKRAKEDKEK
ncbi:MAG: hydrogenase subunit MbhD domain-containing protein [Oscillospiraceae bacterium]